MVTLTEQAGAKIKNIMETEQKVGYGLRLFAKGGGCQGFQYGMAIEEKANNSDQVFESQGIKIFLDSTSAPVLSGSEIDYVDTVQGAGFAIKNPKATSTCGCGHSFSV